MNAPTDDPHGEQLRRLLSDAVSDVEPHDRLDQIRTSVRTDQKVVPMSRTRPWLYAASGVVATVAVIGVIAYATGTLPGQSDASSPTPAHHGPSRHTTASSSPSTPSSPPASPTQSAPAGGHAYAVYYVGDNPAGQPVLFREFHRGSGSSDVASQAVADLAHLPQDPDYRTPWHAGDLTGATVDSSAGVIDVAVGGGVQSRPAGMSPAYAEAALQQVVYTVQAAFQSRMPVQFTSGGSPVGQVLGVPTTQPVSQGDVLTTCSLISISSPNEGDQVSGTLTVTGVNNAFEGTSVIYLERNGKKYLVTPAMGGMGGNKLFPWSVTLDLTKVPAAQYTLVASNDNPSGKGKPATDTRTIIVK